MQCHGCTCRPARCSTRLPAADSCQEMQSMTLWYIALAPSHRLDFSHDQMLAPDTELLQGLTSILIRKEGVKRCDQQLLHTGSTLPHCMAKGMPSHMFLLFLLPL